MQKITLRSVYQIQGTPTVLTDGVTLCAKWFPEVDGIEMQLYGRLPKKLEEDGRLKVVCLFSKNFDGERGASMHTLWFDGKPVAIVKNSGRGGDEDSHRWITDPVQFTALCTYLWMVLEAGSGPDSDIVDPDTLLYPEEVFGVYGGYYGDLFGIAREEPAKGILILWDLRAKHLKNVPAEGELVIGEPCVKEMPEYIRREGYVMQRVRAVSEQEMKDNPNLANGHPNEKLFWYVEHPDAPLNAVIVPV